MFSTEFTDQVEYLEFKEKLRTTLIYVAIAFGIGFVLAFKDGIGAAFFIGFVFAGFPVPWRLMPYHITWFGFLLKVTLCILFGLIITPIILGYYIYQMKRYEKRAQQMSYQQTNQQVPPEEDAPYMHEVPQQSAEQMEMLYVLVEEGSLSVETAAQKAGMSAEGFVHQMVSHFHYPPQNNNTEA